MHVGHCARWTLCSLGAAVSVYEQDAKDYSEHILCSMSGVSVAMETAQSCGQLSGRLLRGSKHNHRNVQSEGS